VILDDQGRVADANPEYVRLTGRQRLDEVLGHSVLEWTAPHDLERNDSEVRKCLEQSFVRHLEIDYVTPSGEVIPIEVNASVFRAAGAVQLLSLCRDMTERKQAQAELRESEDLHRTILQTALSGFWRVDLQCHLLEVNDSYCRMSGYSEQELLAMSVPDLEAAESPTNTAVHLQRIVAQGENHFESWHRRKDGSTFAVEVSVQYKTVAGGQVVAFLRDITARKQAEKRVQMFSHEIIAAREEERKQVSSVLHHDVGSLTVGISAHFDAIEQDLRSGKPKEALQWMKRTRKLFGESVTRLKALAVELRPPELDVIGLSAALRQYLSQVTERGGIRIHFRESLGRRRVPGGNATILFRVAQEALTNAITHGRAKQVDVDVRALKGEVTLTVHDNGKEFDPTEQMARPTSQMGLRVMREMALSAGGVFTVDSGQGKGTTVRVRLPIVDRRMRNAD
jgi:PAS domain S-box-containing protein